MALTQKIKQNVHIRIVHIQTMHDTKLLIKLGERASINIEIDLNKRKLNELFVCRTALMASNISFPWIYHYCEVVHSQEDDIIV